MSITTLGLSSIPPTPLPVRPEEERCETCGAYLVNSPDRCYAGGEFGIPLHKFCRPGCFPPALDREITIANNALAEKRAQTQEKIQENLRVQREAAKKPVVVLPVGSSSNSAITPCKSVGSGASGGQVRDLGFVGGAKFRRPV